MWRRAAHLAAVVLAAGASALGGEADVAVPAPAPTAPIVVGTPPEGGEIAPDRLRDLALTDLQRRVLMDVFHRAALESPLPAPAAATLAVRVDPVLPGGIYRLGPRGDLPARLEVSVRAAPGASVDLRYVAMNFYGAKVADGTLPPVIADAAGAAGAELALKDLAAFGYYHVLVTATSGERTASAAGGVILAQPPEDGAAPDSPFGLAAPPGAMADEIPDLCRRLGVRHVALDWAAEGMQLPAVQAAGLEPTAILGFTIPQTTPEPPAFAGLAGEVVQRHADVIRQWQLGRQPVFAKDGLAEAVASYRAVVSGVLTAVRKTDAKAALWVGTTPEVLAGALTEGPVLAGADGVALYVDACASDTSLRSGAFARSLDYGVQVARRMGITQTAVAGTGEDATVGYPQQQAWKLVMRNVQALAAGAKRVTVTWNRGLPSPMPAAAAYAWMTHMLDGAKYEGDAWDGLPMLAAHVFSGPVRRVAVVWSLAGEDPARPDQGALVFDRGLGLEAVDVVGQPAGIWKDERLIVPLGEAPVYVISSELTAAQVRDRLRRARLVGVPPVALHLQSLTRGAVPGRVSVTLWAQSLRPYRQDVTAGLLVPQGWRARTMKKRFALDAGAAAEAVFECDVVADAGPPPYRLTAVASTDEENVRHTQDVQAAQAARRTIEVGYGLADWIGLDPVVLRDEDGKPAAEVKVAYDKDYFYFAAAVKRDRGTFRTGVLPSEGDAVQLAWGLADRADDDFGHKTRGVALPEGAFRDTDHLMAITFGPDGAQVVRLRGPRMALRSHMPGNMDDWFGPVEGASADISRDAANSLTVYEAAIPLKELAPLRAQEGRVLRFGFRIGRGEGRPLEWAREAGVPDFLANPCSFLPASYAEGLPCQTWWGLVGEK
jgi:hypothetical protein